MQHTSFNSFPTSLLLCTLRSSVVGTFMYAGFLHILVAERACLKDFAFSDQANRKTKNQKGLSDSVLKTFSMRFSGCSHVALVQATVLVVSTLRRVLNMDGLKNLASNCLLTVLSIAIQIP